MPKEDKHNFFTCDKLKGSVNAGSNEVISFTFKPPSVIENIANIDALKGLGQWKELKAELKLIGGFLTSGVVDSWTFEIVLRAYINQI